MSITTKTGDEGMTSLIGGQRVLKCDARVEAYGTLDELSSFIGVLHDTIPAEDGTRSFLMVIQETLLSIEAVLACPKEGMIPHLDESTVITSKGRLRN